MKFKLNRVTKLALLVFIVLASVSQAQEIRAFFAGPIKYILNKVGCGTCNAVYRFWDTKYVTKENIKFVKGIWYLGCVASYTTETCKRLIEQEISLFTPSVRNGFFYAPYLCDTIWQCGANKYSQIKMNDYFVRQKQA